MYNPVASSSKLTLSSPSPSSPASTPRRRRREKGEGSTPSSLGRAGEEGRKSRRAEDGLTPTQPRRVIDISSSVVGGAEAESTPGKKRKKRRDRQDAVQVVD